MAITDSTINSLEFQSKLTGELDKVLVQEAQTSFFADNALRSKFVGARTVLISDVDMQGLGNYNRDDGFVTGALTVSSESYVVPELDAYVLSKLATLATTKSQTVTGTVVSQIYKMITEAINKVQAVAGYSEPLVCFVDSTVWGALMNTTEVTRQINVGEFKKGSVNTKVKYLNDVPIIPVSDDRMKTAYTFYDGVTDDSGSDGADQTVGGFVPATGAKKIGILVLPRRAASLVKKSERIRTFTPEQNQKADAYLFQYRIYYDLFVKKSLTRTVYTYTY